MCFHLLTGMDILGCAPMAHALKSQHTCMKTRAIVSGTTAPKSRDLATARDVEVRVSGTTTGTHTLVGGIAHCAKVKAASHHRVLTNRSALGIIWA